MNTVNSGKITRVSYGKNPGLKNKKKSSRCRTTIPLTCSLCKYFAYSSKQISVVALYQGVIFGRKLNSLTYMYLNFNFQFQYTCQWIYYLSRALAWQVSLTCIYPKSFKIGKNWHINRNLCPLNMGFCKILHVRTEFMRKRDS